MFKYFFEISQMSRHANAPAAIAELSRKYALYREPYREDGVDHARLWKVVRLADLHAYPRKYFKSVGEPLLDHERLEAFSITIIEEGRLVKLDNVRMFGRLPTEPRKFSSQESSLSPD